MALEAKGVALEDFDRKIEILGRLNLWYEALETVRSLIYLSDRARSGRSQPNIVRSERVFREASREYVRTAGLKPNSLSTINKCDQVFPRPFPTFAECCHIESKLQLLAVVVFGQIYKQGERAKGLVASNVDQKMGAIREEMKVYVISEGVSERDYDEIRTRLKEMRDSQISHRNGASANARFGSRLSAFKMMETGIENIDFKLLYSISSIMKDFVHLRIMQLSSELNPYLPDLPQS